MTRWCEVAGGVAVGAEVADDALSEVRLLGHECILRCVHVPPVCFSCQMKGHVPGLLCFRQTV